MKRARGNNKLSALTISRVKQPGSYGDGGGLYLQVSAVGNRHWFFRFMQSGRSRKMGLGSAHLVSLAEAREKALACRRQLLDGIDPIEARQSRKAARLAEQSRQLTFRQCGEKYVAAHAPGWRNADHARQWPSSLEAYAYPHLGDLPVDKIETAHVLRALEPIWTAKSETAARVRARIEAVLDWAQARGYRSGENPARWKGHLKNLLPARKNMAAVKHLAAMGYAELPRFMGELRALPDMDSHCLEFAILTAARSAEVLGARWSEVDLGARMWVVPASRMKGRREHRVPLSDRALEILEGLPREGEFVFARKGKALPRDVLQRVLIRVGREETVHGFRSSFRDWAGETTAFPHELMEMALAHAIGNKVEAAYRRGDMLEKRRRLMSNWAEYCSSPIRDPANVRALRGVARG